MSDTSDQPHAIIAYLNRCQAVITYDTHFTEIAQMMDVYTPEEFLAAFQPPSLVETQRLRKVES